MPLPTTVTFAPYSVTADETNDDTTTAVDGEVTTIVTVTFTGLISQVQADWATIAATNLTCPSVLLYAQDSQA
jgi:hypothetical protein